MFFEPQLKQTAPSIHESFFSHLIDFNKSHSTEGENDLILKQNISKLAFS